MTATAKRDVWPVDCIRLSVAVRQYDRTGHEIRAALAHFDSHFAHDGVLGARADIIPA